MATPMGENVAQVVQQIFAMRSSNVKCTKEKYEWTVLAGLVRGSTDHDLFKTDQSWDDS